MNLSLQLLLVLALYPDPTGEANQYRKSMSRLHRVEDFQFIQQGLTTVLTQPVYILPFQWAKISRCADHRLRYLEWLRTSLGISETCLGRLRC